MTSTNFLARKPFKNRVSILVALIFCALFAFSGSPASAQEIMPSFSTFPTGWTTDRYEPASFTNVGIYQGRPNVLGIAIDSTTARLNRTSGFQTTFYNTQGRAYAFSPAQGPGVRVSAMLYIPAAWANEANGTVRSDMWARAVDVTNTEPGASYPIIGFTNYNGGGRYRIWDPQNGGWVESGLPAVAYDAWTSFTYEFTASSFNYYINGVLVYTDNTINGAVTLTSAMLQAYNFEDSTLPAPAPLSTAPYTAHWSNLSATVVTVRPETPNNWGFFNDETNTVDPSLGTWVNGPAPVPYGNGSVQISVTGTQRRNLATSNFGGTMLSDITVMKFSTYNPSAGNGGSANRSGYLNFNVDFTGSNTYQNRLVYVPETNGTVIQDTWQEWDTINGGNAAWTFSGSTWPAGIGGGGEAGTTSKTWNQILSQYPNARMLALYPFTGVRVGEPYADGYTENIDSFTFGTPTATTLYNFEPTAIRNVDPDGFASATDCNDATTVAHQTIGAAVTAANPGDTIRVCPGTYNESPQINKSLTLQSTGGRDVTTIQLLPTSAPGTGYLAGVYINSPTATVVIDGFTITGNDATNPVLANSNVVVQTANGVTVTNSRLKVGAIDAGSNGDDGIGVLTTYASGAGAVTVTNNEFMPVNTSAARAFYINPAAGTSLSFQNNQVTGNFTRNAATECGGPISNNTFTGTGASGGFGAYNFGGPACGDPGPFTNNEVSGATAGILIYGANNTVLTGNAFTGNGSGILIDAVTVTGTVAHYNRIANNTTAGFTNNTASVVNAENNWWGCNYGPGVAGVGCPTSPNGIVGSNVDGSPWLTLTTAASPNLVIIPATSTVTSKLVWNSDGVDTSVTATVLDTTPVSFAGTFGSVSPTNTTLTSGVASTTFTPTTPGAGNVATTVDGQTTDAPITVLATCATISSPTTTQTLTGATVVVPINTTDVTTRGVLSTDMTVTYDPAVLTPSAGAPFYGVTVGAVGASGGAPNLTVNSPAAGTLVISLYDANPWSGAGQVVNLSFTAIGLPATTSPITFSGVRYNYDTPCVNTSNGLVTVISGTISGVVSYANAKLPAPGFRPVPNTTLNAVGSINQSANSAFVTGAYSLSGMGAGGYTVTPSKSGDVNGILSNDASLIAQHVVGLTTLDAAQIKAAKVAGNPILTSFDAALIARYIVLLPNYGLTGSWVFDPVNRSYPDVNTDQTNQDYAGTLMGDVDGNWVAPVSLGGLYQWPSLPQQKPIGVEVPAVQAGNDSIFNVPVTVGNVTERGILGYQFDVEYDPTVIEPIETRIDRANTMSGEYAMATNIVEPGLMKVVLYGVTPLMGEGTLANLRFRAVGAEGSASPIRIVNFVWHDGSIPAEVKDGSVEIRAEANGNSIGGLVMSPTGEPVSGGRVTFTDLEGQSRSAITNAFGQYQVDGLTVGRTYTVSVQSKRFTFTPVTVSVTNEPLSRLDLVANQ